jgi:4-amino-4-deoxy-L-arabinose transferase-like glycosyltransferase
MENKRDFKGKFLSVLENGKTFYAVLAAGVLVRVGVLIALAPTRLFSDAKAYHIFARRLAEGETFRPSWPPGLPLILAGPYALFGPDYIVARFVMLGIYVVFAALLFLLVKRLSGTATANFSVLIFTFYPLCVFYSLTTLTQLITAATLVGVAFLMLSLLNKNRWYIAVILGFALGFLTLTRASGALILLAVPAYFMLRKGYGIKAGAVFVIAILPVALWCYNVYRVADRVIFVNTANAKNFFVGNNEYAPLYKTWYFGSHDAKTDDEGLIPEGYIDIKDTIREYPEHERQFRYIEHSVRHIINNPHLFAIRTFNRIRVFFAFDTYLCAILLNRYDWPAAGAFIMCVLDAGIYVILLFGTAVFLFLVRPLFREKEASTILLGLPLLYALPYFLAFSHPTYHFPVVPFFAVFLSVFVVEFLKRRKGVISRIKTFSRFKLAVFAAAVLLLILIQVEWFIAMIGRF